MGNQPKSYKTSFLCKTFMAHSNISTFPIDLNPRFVSQELIFVQCFVLPEKGHGATTLYNAESQLKVENGVCFLFSDETETPD